MKRYHIIICILILFCLLFILTGCTNKEKQENIENGNIETSRLSSTINEEYAENRVANILQNSNEILQNSNEVMQNSVTNETEISSYATTIKDKEAGRLTNISITCSILNNTIIHPSETFSFNNIVGKPTPERGYQEASVIIDHQTQRGIGGRKLSSK